jgi:hypothetical protein
MEIHNVASFLIANRFGFGKYRDGMIFAKHPKAQYSLYIADNKMAVLSYEKDKDGNRTVVADSSCFSLEELDTYFSIDYTKSSKINWFQPVNFGLFCNTPKLICNNIIYFICSTVKLRFQEALTFPNTVLVYDVQTPPDILHELKMKAGEAPFAGRVEFWSTLKLVDFCERMGNFASNACQENAIQAYEKCFS